MIEPAAADRDQRFEALAVSFSRFRSEVRAAEPEAWALQLPDLTTLGYLQLAIDIADAIAAARLPADARILDWGAGPGFLAYLLQELGLTVTCYDFASGAPGTVRALSPLHGDKRFIDDPVRLPFEDATFDAAVSFGVLEHVPDAPASVAEAMRVLESGGLFLYHFPNRYSWTENLARLLGRPHHDSPLSRRRLRRLLSVPDADVYEMSYRYLIPRNLVDMPRLRAFISRHARAVYGLDAALVRIPALNLLSTTHNVTVRKSPTK